MAAGGVAAAVVVAVPATCGELVQGVEPRIGPLLVSLPVDRAGHTRVSLTAEGPLRVHPRRPRADRALRLAVDRVGWRGGALVELDESIPVGRGWGSSTVDVAGVLIGVAAAAGLPITRADLLRCMAEVEPSDGSPLPGLWAVDHVGGRAILRLGSGLDAWVAAVDQGRPVDTVGLHAACGPGPALPAGTVARLATAVRSGDLATVGALACRSAVANQERLPNPALPAVLAAATAVGAAGVVVAHSGSLAAVLAGDVDTAEHACAQLRRAGLDARRWRVRCGGARLG